MKRLAMILAIGVFAFGCAAPSSPKVKSAKTLQAPGGTVPAAKATLEEGNRLYAARQWTAARAQYEAAIKVQPTLAEAHYNLALVFDELGDSATAKKHYIEAANLAPGHQVIWNSPPLRKHGGVAVEGGKLNEDFLTPKPR